MEKQKKMVLPDKNSRIHFLEAVIVNKELVGKDDFLYAKILLEIYKLRK